MAGRMLSTSQLAGVIGISPASLSHYLSGRAMPALEVLATLTRFLGILTEIGGVKISPIENPHEHNERQLFLRASRAHARYQRDSCHLPIGVGTPYFQDEPHPAAGRVRTPRATFPKTIPTGSFPSPGI
jgi:transcriptional regulator with XRE-family HTH domain